MIAALSPAQAAAVRATGHVAITACPGSGKTTTLAARADRLLQDQRHRIGCATFSVEAAHEIEHKIRARMPSAGARLVCGTFHSLAAQQLRERGHRKPIISHRERVNEILRVRDELWSGRSRPTLDVCSAIIEHYKSRLPGDPIPPLPPHDADECAALVEAYDASLRRQGVGDFHDIMRDAVVHMRAGRIAPMTLSHLLVDEFQDTDPTQSAWIGCHALKGTEITVVGDDDQSIYGWRNAQGFAGLRDFMRDFSAAHVALDDSYRCPPEILKLAARLIAHNSERVPKALRSGVSRSGKVQLIRHEDEPKMLDQVVSTLRGADPGLGRWVVLARTNAQLDVLETRLSGEVDYRRIGGRSVLDMRDPALVMSICNSLVNRSMVGFSNLLTRCGVDADLVAEPAHDVSALDSFIDRDPNHFSAPVAAAYASVREKARAWNRLTKDGRLELLWDDVQGTVCELVERMNAPPETKARAQDAVKALTKRLRRAKGTLAHRVRTLSEDRRRHENTAVTLCTLHAAKGLEWDQVWIVGCDQGRLPYLGANVAEERRLLYVGMTRARTGLRISFTNGMESEFLAELSGG